MPQGSTSLESPSVIQFCTLSAISYPVVLWDLPRTTGGFRLEGGFLLKAEQLWGSAQFLTALP